MEPQEIVSELNRIQEAAYKGKLEKTDKTLWHSLCADLALKGYKVRKRKVANLYGREKAALWFAERDDEGRQRHFEAEWVKFDPPKNIKSECTTRCLFFVFGESLNYNAIRERQNLLAYRMYGQGRCYGWNHESVFKILLQERGFEKISFSRTIRRDRLAKALSGCGRILTHSSHHVAGIADGKVYDSWNSMHGRCNYIYLQKEFVMEARRRLGV